MCEGWRIKCVVQGHEKGSGVENSTERFTVVAYVII